MEEPATHFQFEADFVAALRCIPMYVRFKLDTVGLKLKLSHWAGLDRQASGQRYRHKSTSVFLRPIHRSFPQGWSGQAHYSYKP
jgi:hypothetical protein